MDYDSIPPCLKSLNQWVCVHRDSKVPMRAFEHAPASSTDPASWASFDNAVRAVEMGRYDNIGFVFNNNGIVGIDIDCGYDEDGLITPVAADILGLCRSYTERSRSGRGFHVIVRGDLSFNGKNNLNGVEIYRASRYFIMTGDSLVFHNVIDNQAAVYQVVNTYFREAKRTGKNNLLTSRVYSPEWELPKLKVEQSETEDEETGAFPSEPIGKREPMAKWRVKLRPVYPRIPAGSRNICLTSLAGMMHNMGYTKSQIYDELQYANAVACDPSLEKRELRSIVNSVTRYKR